MTTGITTSVAVGAVADVWRYPVKSMLGERLSEITVTADGTIGDRAWALREVSSGRIASAKRFPRLLACCASYETEPSVSRPGSVRIETPDDALSSDDTERASAVMSAFLGREVVLENRAGQDEKTGIDPSTVFGDVPVAEMKLDWTPETAPDYFRLRRGSFFEIGPIFVLTSGSVAHLRTLQGGTAQIDQRRFRPNIYIESLPEWVGFVEDAWIDGTLAVGDALTCGEFKPTLWCVTATLAQQGMPRDLSILRTAARHHRGCLGVYASVRSPGRVAVGDQVRLTAADA